MLQKRLVTTFLILTTLLLGACANRAGPGGKMENRFDPRYLAKSEIDRVIDTNRTEVMAGLRRIAEKLYKRNPKEWQKSGQAGIEPALERLFSGRTDFPELEGRREGAAALHAFSASYKGDRVLALMAGLLGMSYAAFEHKDDFYLLDDLNEQKLYNCARNIEIAIWKMSSTKKGGNVGGNSGGNGDDSHEPILLSNELDPNNPNLTFEREFGRIIGLLDFLSKVVADKNGRTITRFTQSLATALFLPVSALGIR